ncbi:TIGR01621 family pseudouridine synthase [Colwellia echini]|uniref:TIGR01621 family pseudouridine synthase n=1 Tax=Colwellia echini TaxID=1982103 RepID=A0ABY3MV06_9GAMM|nr:TIGR01621 family pseudouridine synthase [Colwellia echini]TYK65042.1 TIGR01621 family pseudouridine synthase [Colwellia echini]
MFKIIAQHPDFIVVNKEAGVNFHDEGEIGTGLHSLVKAQLKTQSLTTEAVELFPVHRLDKMTSGLVIFAKNLAAAQAFGILFSEHLIEKYYLAIADKKPVKKQGLIKGDMAKSRRGMLKLLRSMVNPAITQFFSYSTINKQRLYLLKPHSGKTHQLRVALASIGAPIIGDPLYYSQSVADRGYLHAYALRFDYLGDSFEFICPPASGEYFLEESVSVQLAEIKKPWLVKWPKL